MLIALAGLQQSWLDGFTFMVLMGLGLYLPYVAVHTTIFERLIAMTRERGNLGFLMYVADAVGYLGYAALMIAKGLFPSGPRFPAVLHDHVLGCRVARVRDAWRWVGYTSPSGPCRGRSNHKRPRREHDHARCRIPRRGTAPGAPRVPAAGAGALGSPRGGRRLHVVRQRPAQFAWPPDGPGSDDSRA